MQVAAKLAVKQDVYFRVYVSVKDVYKIIFVSFLSDGVMVQMIRQMSEEMRQAMREMSDFTIHTGCTETDAASIQQVVFEWVSKRNADIQR